MRVVSLCPSITESLIALGAADDLVGVTRYCIHPREVVRGLRKVGGTKNPDLAAIRALAPDLVFLNSEENRREDHDALASEFEVDVSHPRAPGDVPPLLRRWGRLVGRDEAGEGRAREVEDAIAALRSERPPAFSYAYLIWKNPWMSVSDDTYVAGLLRAAGGENVFGRRAEPYPAVTEKEIVASRPDVLLLPDEPYRFREEHRAAWVPLLPDAEVLLVSGDDLCWHGVRTTRGLAAARDVSRAFEGRA